MVCYYFPPITDVGSKRSIAFAKYFRKHGWRPVVLSVKNPDRDYCVVGRTSPPDGMPTSYAWSLLNLSWILGKSNGLLSRLLRPFGVELRRNVLHDLVCYPDRFLGWIPLATVKGARMVRTHHIEAIYVSCSPFSGAVVGLLLKKLTGKPLILDFRDPFVTGRESFIEGGSIRKGILSRLEKGFVNAADVLLLTSEETRQAYIDKYPTITPKTFTVYNGFDPPAAREKREAKYDKFSIIYTGQFYTFGPDHETHTAHFFEALAHLKSAGDISKDNFQFQFFGDERSYIEERAISYGVADLVIGRPRVPYEEALDAVLRSHLMLLRIVKLMISTKLFEGIPLGVPFLATIPHGEVEEIIKEYSPGSYVIGEDGTYLQVADAIRDAMARYARKQVPANRVEEFLARFTREKLTQQVMQIVDGRLSEQGSAR